MIFKRPDAFIIKHVKLIHAIILVCIGYLLIRTNDLSNFYNHVEKAKSIIGESNLEKLFNPYMFLALIISLALAVIIMVLLIKKKKKYVFYLLINILLVATLVFYIMSFNNIKAMEKADVAAPVYLAYGDISEILFYIQSVSVLAFILKTVGFDFKNFTLGKNILGIDVTEADSEEVELNLEIDKNEIKTKNRKKIRELKYLYFENRFKVNLIVFLVISIIAVFTWRGIESNKEVYYPIGAEFNSRGYRLVFNELYRTNVDYNGEKIGSNETYMILLFKVKKETDAEQVFDVSNIVLNINGKSYYADSKYNEYFAEFGTPYKEQKLTKEFLEYYLVFKVPYDFSTKEIYILTPANFDYSTNNYSYYKSKVEYKTISENISTHKASLNNEMSINAYGVKNKVIITTFDFKNRYKLTSKWNSTTEKIYDLIEYIVPVASDNEEKTIMMLIYEEKVTDGVTFASILSKYATIEYEIAGVKKEGKIYSFITPEVVKNQNTYYIEVSRDVLNGINRTLKIKIRDQVYEYALG